MAASNTDDINQVNNCIWTNSVKIRDQCYYLFSGLIKHMISVIIHNGINIVSASQNHEFILFPRFSNKSKNMEKLWFKDIF